MHIESISKVCGAALYGALARYTNQKAVCEVSPKLGSQITRGESLEHHRKPQIHSRRAIRPFHLIVEIFGSRDAIFELGCRCKMIHLAAVQILQRDFFAPKTSIPRKLKRFFNASDSIADNIGACRSGGYNYPRLGET